MVYTLYHPFMVKLGMAYYWVCQNHTVFIHPRVHIPQTSPNRPLAAGTPADCKTPQARATSVNSARTSHQIDDEAKENHKFTLEHGNERSPINVNEMGNIQDEMGKYVYYIYIPHIYINISPSLSHLWDFFQRAKFDCHIYGKSLEQFEMGRPSLVK